MFRFLAVLWPARSEQLPGAVLTELVDLMFTAVASVVTIAFAVFCVSLFIACRDGDAVMAVLTVGSAVVAGLRVLIIIGYRRRPVQQGAAALASIKLWERRYGAGSFSFAVLLGMIGLRALTISDPYVPMLISGLIFGYGSGLITRIAVRPAICGVSVLLAIVPIAFGLGLLALRQHSLYAGIAFAGQMVLILGFAVIGLETMAKSYQTILTQLLANRDLAAMAGQDALTGLPNRLLLRSRFAESLASSELAAQFVAVHCLDLDRFKAVNDTFGHPVGDALLQAVSKRLLRTLKTGDTVARTGGDEFVIVQGGIKEPDEAGFLARRVIRIVSAPYSIQGHHIRIGVSVGIAITPRDGGNLEELLGRADAALYVTKGEKRGGVAFWGETPPPKDITPAAA